MPHECISAAVGKLHSGIWSSTKGELNPTYFSKKQYFLKMNILFEDIQFLIAQM